MYINFWREWQWGSVSISGKETDKYGTNSLMFHCPLFSLFINP